MNSYDVAIVGAGINACSLAYELHKRGQRVLVLEQNDIASGGSGAAGAFINPKISKSGPLKELIETAYLYSLDFYSKYFPQFTSQAPLLHISKYEDENDKVEYFKEHTALSVGKVPDEIASKLSSYARSFSSVYLKENAIVEAKDVCEAMLEGIRYHQCKVQKPVYKEGQWNIEGYRADKLVLCTGAYEQIFDEPYLQLRSVYGQRCEIESSTPMPATVHHEVSISARKKNGRISLGASHYLNADEMPSPEQGAEELIALATKTLNLDNVRVHDTFIGMRSGSNDYLPIMGALVDAKRSVENDPRALKGDRNADLIYYPQLYMINGVGGYGFVLAPYLSSIMASHLSGDKALPESLQPSRFYYRWAKKKGTL